MASEGEELSFSMASVVESVLQQHGVRSRDLDLDSRRAEEAGEFIYLIFMCLCCNVISSIRFDCEFLLLIKFEIK